MVGDKLTRREFIQRTIAASAGLAGAAALGTGAVATAQQTAATTSRVIHMHAPGVLDLQARHTDYQKTKMMVQTGICYLTGELDVEAAWQRLVGPQDSVGIKINCLGGAQMYNNTVLLQVIKEQLMAVGVKPGNIIVFDRYGGHLQGTGFTIGQQEDGTWVRATDGAGPGYDSAVTQQFPAHGKSTTEAAACSKIVTQQITKMINVPILKNHGGAGITLALKNIAFGIFRHTGSAHDNHCDPYIPYMCRHPLIRQKTVLHILDALKGQYEGGPGGQPQFQWAQQSLLMSQDPVALDFLGAQLLNQARQEHGKSLISNNHMSHIFTAAQLGVGTSDPAQIDVIQQTIA